MEWWAAGSVEGALVLRHWVWVVLIRPRVLMAALGVWAAAVTVQLTLSTAAIPWAWWLYIPLYCAAGTLTLLTVRWGRAPLRERADGAVEVGVRVRNGGAQHEIRWMVEPEPRDVVYGVYERINFRNGNLHMGTLDSAAWIFVRENSCRLESKSMRRYRKTPITMSTAAPKRRPKRCRQSGRPTGPTAAAGTRARCWAPRRAPW